MRRSGFDHIFEVFDSTNTHVFTTVSKHTLFSESVKDRTYDRTARSDEIGQLLLCESKMLSETVLAARQEASRQLTKSFGQADLGAFEREALKSAFHPGLALRKDRDKVQCGCRVVK